jgi:hypothetical protein
MYTVCGSLVPFFRGTLTSLEPTMQKISTSSFNSSLYGISTEASFRVGDLFRFRTLKNFSGFAAGFGFGVWFLTNHSYDVLSSINRLESPPVSGCTTFANLLYSVLMYSMEELRSALSAVRCSSYVTGYPWQWCERRDSNPH